TLPAPPTTVTLRFMNLLLVGGRARPRTTNHQPIRSAHRACAESYSHFLLKTLLKRSGCARDRASIPSNLAVCTIVVRALQPRATTLDAARGVPSLVEGRRHEAYFRVAVARNPSRRLYWAHQRVVMPHLGFQH